MQLFSLTEKISKNRHKLLKLLIHALFTGLLVGCIPSNQPSNNEITLIASPGLPLVDSIVWSPNDENKILVTAGDVGLGRAEVYVLDIDTGEKRILAKTEHGDFVASTWAPNNNLALLSVREDTKGYEPGGLWILNMESLSSEYFGEFGYGVWSPDGKTIATFSKENINTDSKKIALHLIDVATKSEDIIYTNKDAKYFFGLTWSPDGKNLAFVLGQEAPGNLYLTNLETKQTTLLTDNRKISNPVWSPKGNIIAYVNWPPEGINKTLHLTNSNGTCDIEIPKLVNVWSPTWSPDGKKLAYVGSDGIYFLEINKLLGKDIYQSFCP